MNLTRMEWHGSDWMTKITPITTLFFLKRNENICLLAVLTEDHRLLIHYTAVVFWMVQIFVFFALVCHTYHRHSYTKQVDDSFHTRTATTLTSQGVYFRFCIYAIKNKPVVRLIAQIVVMRSYSHNLKVCNFCFSVCTTYFIDPSGVQNNFPFTGTSS